MISLHFGFSLPDKIKYTELVDKFHVNFGSVTN